MDHIADVGRPCSRVKMIELQDYGIAHPTFHAGMLAKKLGDEDTIRLALQRVVTLITLQIHAFIVGVVLPGNQTAACAATRVALIGRGVFECEIVDRMQNSASFAQLKKRISGHTIL